MFWTAFLVVTCLKILLLNSYFSTDLEVHRNWLATTYSLPLTEWYSANHSQWTLDYPPFFAYFERALAQAASFVDSKMLDVENLNYRSTSTVYFHRFSVMITDLVYAYGVKECGKFLSESRIRKSSMWHLKWNSPAAIMQLLFLLNGALLLVDHVHFQYNGFLLGILLISIVRMLQDKKLESAVWFVVLLNLKHIYIYVAPAYFIYLLRDHCFCGPTTFHTFSTGNFIKLSATVIVIFTLSFGPFIYSGCFWQVYKQLFPFKRGICHSYWAPNFWALYNFLDKIFTFTGKKLGFDITNEVASMTGGLVQQYRHTVLPSVSPAFTFFISICAIMPSLWKLWANPGNPFHFVRCLIICAISSFFFGWHVHEKAILICVIPLTFMSVISKDEAAIYLLLSAIANYSVFPLFFTPFEIPIKVLIGALHCVYAFSYLPSLYNTKRSFLSLPMLRTMETLYLAALVPLFIYDHFLQYVLGWNETAPFLPLMLTSVHNAVGVAFCYVKYYWFYLNLDSSKHKRKTY